MIQFSSPRSCSVLYLESLDRPLNSQTRAKLILTATSGSSLIVDIYAAGVASGPILFTAKFTPRSRDELLLSKGRSPYARDSAAPLGIALHKTSLQARAVHLRKFDIAGCPRSPPPPDFFHTALGLSGPDENHRRRPPNSSTGYGKFSEEIPDRCRKYREQSGFCTTLLRCKLPLRGVRILDPFVALGPLADVCPAADNTATTKLSSGSLHIG